jgi:hypothetical protein
MENRCSVYSVTLKGLTDPSTDPDRCILLQYVRSSEDAAAFEGCGRLLLRREA